MNKDRIINGIIIFLISLGFGIYNLNWRVLFGCASGAFLIGCGIGEGINHDQQQNQ